MTLQSKMQELDPKELVYIGAKSGFLFINYPTNFDAEIGELNRRYMNSALTTLKNAQNRYNSMRDFGPKLAKRLQQDVQEAAKAVTKFKGFEDRTVIECYRNISNTGTIIIISGQESGRFWTYDEVLNSNKLVEEEDE